ncbi:ribosome-binding factor A [Candidatus Berkelbacteria bacterium RIFCSPHIGHO2_12_FULL_36_9]|uniref:Ribosome-binding factor A n=1 Tax=Candidatus Berkelbacteria bacterium RIFCSPHIGHO2_12_FULL_36_9 TaxID=1797469 RepID=A0A1F5EKP6_9BACT|nr:MAG: ribosome-binding factor A [Candidatus Berkelbacteria bacterium RIFCSPHIGHO2_12_FULL_36_9]
MEKINELIKKLISLEVQKLTVEEFGLVTITAVICESNLKSARVYFSVLESSKNNKIKSKLQQNAYQMQGILAKKMSTKNIPKLEFIYDESQEKVDRVHELLEQIYKEK